MNSSKGDALICVSGVIFDLDGTLLDTMVQWNSLGADYLRHLGYEPKPDMLDTISNMSLRECIAYFKSEYKISLDPEAMNAALQARLVRLYAEETREKDGAVETLRLLKEHGVKIAVATATSKELAIAGLKLVGAYPFVDLVLSCRDPEIKAHKNSPKIYQEAQRRLGVKREETVVVEDALYAIQTAKRAGYFVVGIEDESERSRKETILDTVDVYCRNHQEIQGWLRAKLDVKP